MNYQYLLEISIRAAIAAGDEILSVYETKTDVELKSDNSPLTIADKLAHRKIAELLSETNLPVLSEEGKTIPYEERKKWLLFWLVDPLDGTKEFIKKNGEFTVNIALISNQLPVIGVVYAPVTQVLYFAESATGSFKIIFSESERSLLRGNGFLPALLKKSVRLPENLEKKKFTVVASRSHLSEETQIFIDDLKKRHGEIEFVSSGSSLKLCLVAEGAADIYPRLAPTMEWDTAAGQAVAMYAGKTVRNFKNDHAVKYNKENLLNEWFVVA